MTNEQTMARTKLRADAIALRGQKSAREIAALHGVTKGVVIGIWHRAKLPIIRGSAKGRLISRGRKMFPNGTVRHRIIRPSSMPSKARLAATPRSKADWWSEMYLDEVESAR